MTKQANLAILVTFSFISLGVLVWIFINRSGYPFDLEWMEGGMLMHAVRLSEGKALYGPPTTEFVPYFYTPGYPAVVAVLGKVFGISYGLGRSISIAATMGILWLTFSAIKRESSWHYGLVGVGIYAILFRTNGAFYDLARPDSLFLVLVLWAMYLTRFNSGMRMAFFTGCICALSFLTKQTASVFFVAICIVHFVRSWRDGLVCALSGVGLTVLGCVLLNTWSDGWFWTYIFEGHQGHVFIWNNILVEYWRDLLFLAPILLWVPFIQFWKKVPFPIIGGLLVAHWCYAFWLRATSLDYVPHMYYRELWYETPRFAILILPGVVAVLAGFTLWRVRHKTFKSSWIWLWFFVAGCGVSGLNHSTQWAYANCFMPISMTAAILVGLTIKDVFEHSDKWAMGSVTLLLVLQFVGLYYSPQAQVPQAEDRTALKALEERLSSREGTVLIPTNPFMSFQARETFHTHRMGLKDVAFLGGVEDLPKRIRQQGFGTVILGEGGHLPGLDRSYYEGPKLSMPTRESLRMKTGYLTRVRSIWYLRNDGERALATGVTGTFEDDLGGWQVAGEAFIGRGGRVRFGGRGAQGRYVLKSERASKGRLTADLDGSDYRELNLLVGGQCKACFIEVSDIEKQVVRYKLPRGRGPLTRIHIPFPEGLPLGGDLRVMILDDDPNGSLIVDDIRAQ